MAMVRMPPPWRIPEHQATSETIYRARRQFLRLAGLGGLGLAASACSAGGELSLAAPPGDSTASVAPPPSYPEIYAKGLYPARRNPAFTLDRHLTDEQVAAATINYYEFTTDKPQVASLARDFTVHPWNIEVDGLVERPRIWGMEEILKRFSLEERLYRHRCVERWAMAVPWTGFPLARFIEACKPLSAARYVRFVSFLRPEEAPGQRTQSWYPWPYFEALSLPEAMNDLCLMATGIYGHPLPTHHGSPLRLVVPWKYGYKSIKGIVRVEFTREQPPTFWNQLQPAEYGLVSNVDPGVPHPRWPQTSERLIGTEQHVATQKYNGYGAQVAHLYPEVS